MKVGLVSNWDLQCGNAQYARDLQTELEREFDVVGLPPNVAQLRTRSDIAGLNALIINWHSARVTVTQEDFRWLRAIGIKTVLIHQNFVEGEEIASLGADKIVVHEPVENALAICIPHGIPIVEVHDVNMNQRMVGTAGFPFPWKRFDVVAEAAKRFNLTCRMYAPKSDQLNTDVFMDGIAGHLGPLAEIHRQWEPVEVVIKGLQECAANIFWFQTQDPCDQLGQSGSVRLGLAAMRPTIISTHRKLRTLFKYTNELYICEKEEEVYEALEEILEYPELTKIPARLLVDQNWFASGLKYRTLVKELIGELK